MLSNLYMSYKIVGMIRFGIAFDKETNKFKTNKRSIYCDVGDTYKLFKEETKMLSSTICMGHSRWATHGKVDLNNTHPHVSNNKIFYLVHNGIIENYKELKHFLIEKGYSFTVKQIVKLL